ncbi:glycoside hydrolase family 92 protein [Lacticaseibacillus camelliae]|nr:glycoside hydrolase family 92 protein [Lacticaseibacillus camelliae]
MSKNQFGQINIGDQPSFHLPYLFHFVGKPYYAQPLLKQLMTRLFSAGVKGYPGDEDNGSMSAWYIFNALGLYPFCPGTGEYLIGIPLFDEAKVHLSNGQTVRITASSNHPQQQFVDSLTRDGKPFKTSFITHDQLLQTNQLQFALGTVPNPFCFDDTKRPFSLSQPEE